MYFDEIREELLRNAKPLESLISYPADAEKMLHGYGIDQTDEEGKAVYQRLCDTPCVFYWIQTEEGRLISLSPNPDKEIHFEVRFDPGIRTILHRHDFIELGYVLGGESRQVFTEREYVFSTGSFWLSDRNCMHQDLMGEGNLFTIFFILPKDFFEARFLETIEDQSLQLFLRNALMLQKKIKQFISFIPQKPCTEIYDLLVLMAKEATIRQSGWQLILQGNLSRLFSLLIQHYKLVLTNQDRLTEGNIIFSDMAEYMNEHCADVTLSLLAKRYHYSSDYLSRLIKSNSGMIYSEYLQNLRIEKACRLLKKTKEPIDYIIEQVGYKNIGYFYEIFHKACGMTPNQYRERNNKNRIS